MGVSCFSTLQLIRWSNSSSPLACLAAAAGPPLSSTATPAWPRSCRNRDSTPEEENLVRHSRRKMESSLEESSGNNNRIGQYSYIGDDGKTCTVKYSAGADGFRILGGDHIPSGGQTSAAAEMGENGEPKEYDYEYYDDTKPESPFVNPFDPTHRQEFLLAGNLAGHLAQRKFTTPPPALPGSLTTEPAHRFFPPGQIKLDRFPEGFNFQFQSQK